MHSGTLGLPNAPDQAAQGGFEVNRGRRGHIRSRAPIATDLALAVMSYVCQPRLQSMPRVLPIPRPAWTAVSDAMLGPGDPQPLESRRPEGRPKRWRLDLALPGTMIQDNLYYLAIRLAYFTSRSLLQHSSQIVLT